MSAKHEQGQSETLATTTPAPAPETKPAPAVSAAPTGEEIAARAAQIVDLCNGAGEPKMAAKLIRDGVSVEDARKAVTAAADIRGIVAAAHKVNPAIEMSQADVFIAAGTSAEGVRAALFERMLALQSPEIVNAHSLDGQTSAMGAKAFWAAVHQRSNFKKG